MYISACTRLAHQAGIHARIGIRKLVTECILYATVKLESFCWFAVTHLRSREDVLVEFSGHRE
jgi:hypothetical protein